MSDFNLPKDQLINQIIHQGKAPESTNATRTYSDPLPMKRCELRPVPGSRDKTTQPIPRGGRSEIGRPSKAPRFDSLICRPDINGFNIRRASANRIDSSSYREV